MSGTVAVVLAAGSPRRMGAGVNKLLVEIDGEAMVRRVVRTVLGGRVARVVVVLGHEADRVRAALTGLDVSFVENPDHASGMASSLRVGVGAVADDADSVLVVLADMPRLRVETIDRLIAASGPGRIVAPVHAGHRGNPVLWDRVHFPDLSTLTGDAGARALIAARPEALVPVPVDDPGTLFDLDTPGAILVRS